MFTQRMGSDNHVCGRMSKTVLALICTFMLTLVTAVCFAAHDVERSRKEKLLKQHGYTKFLFRGSTMSNNAIFAWSNGEFRIMDREIERLTYRELNTKLCTVL